MFKKIAAITVFLLAAAAAGYAAKTTFIDGDPGTGTKGTRVYALFLNALNNHYHDGLSIDGHGALPYSAATGTNDYILTLSPALTQYVTGMPIYFSVAHANTGAVTININGLGSTPVKKEVSNALNGGDIPINKMMEIRYDGTNFQLINPTNIIGNVQGNATTATTASVATQFSGFIPGNGGVITISSLAGNGLSVGTSTGTTGGVAFFNSSNPWLYSTFNPSTGVIWTVNLASTPQSGSIGYKVLTNP
jgi:hypothetical protein